MGACLLGEKVKDVLTPGSHGSTFGGNPICAAAALSVQRRLTDTFLAEVTAKGGYISRELSAVPGVTSVSGRGLMLGVQSGRDAGGWCARCLSAAWSRSPPKQSCRLLPPLTISWPELERAVGITKEELQQ